MSARWLAWALACATAAPAGAASLAAVGALGNSGEAGAMLLRAKLPAFDRSACGVALDADGALWISGGDAVNRVGLDGRLIERFPLEPAGSTVDSKTFAVLKDVLYFLGRTADGTLQVFALAMRGEGKRAAKPLAAKLPDLAHSWIPPCLAPQPLDGKLVILAEGKELPPATIGVYVLSPAEEGAGLKLAFTVAGEYPGGVAVNEARRVIYVGAALETAHPSVEAPYSIAALRADGTLLSGDFPAPCTKTPAVPTQFRGVVSLAGGALWETAWYGFLSRLDLEARGAPGRVVEWHHELGYPSQVVEIGAAGNLELVGITTAMPDAFYLAHWDRGEQRLAFVRRIGCLPLISSLGISADGWVTASTARAQLWWRWEDAADAPPRKAELHVGVTPGCFRDERLFALAAQYRLDDLNNRNAVPTVFSRRVGERNEALRVGDPVPMKKPVGLGVQVTPGSEAGAVFVSDAATQKLWRTSIWLPELRPDGAKWAEVKVAGDAGPRAPTDVVALTDGRLLVADDGRIIVLAPQGDGYAVAAEFAKWGDGPEQRFGKRLRMAADGPWMLVADTDRQRVVWIDWSEWKVLGQMGETDKGGDGARHLDAPTLVAVRGDAAVVADAGNQRIVKVILSP